MPVEGMMNSKAYLPIIERNVSTELSKLHPQAIFQQDSAPGHKAKIITNCLKKNKNNSTGLARELARFKFHRKLVVDC